MKHSYFTYARIRILALVLLLALPTTLKAEEEEWIDHYAEGERVKSTGLTYEDCDILYLTGDFNDMLMHAQCSSNVRAFHRRVDKQTMEFIRSDNKLKRILGGSK